MRKIYTKTDVAIIFILFLAEHFGGIEKVDNKREDVRMVHFVVSVIFSLQVIKIIPYLLNFIFQIVYIFFNDWRLI